ncbi:unnamed protein product [Rotaria magnacalcarata]|uniref:Uncharacterized protein n=1 Tax=Rotaria magnacalcarata TaxID=392030 RepID=A0A819U394_9BILA|nr:unnamed protein product [Rotaria magnacalcarata]
MNDETQLLIGRKQRLYDNTEHQQRQSSRLEWAEASWTRWWYVLCWWWMNPILWLSYKRALNDEDLDDLPHQDKSSILLNQLQAYDWKTTTTQHIITRTFWKSLLVTGLLLLPRMVFRIGKAMILREIILFISSAQIHSSKTLSSGTVGYLYALALLFCIFMETLFHHQFLYRSTRIGLKIRNALTSVIYSHLLSVNTASLHQTTVAQMVNFIAYDATKFDDLAVFIHYLWQAPLEAALVFALLCWIIGPLPILIGYAILVLLIPIQILFGRKFTQYCSTTAMCADKRIRAFSELIHGAQIIKMYNWEKSMEVYVRHMRQEEFASIKRASHLRAINMCLFFVSIPLIVLATFGSAWLMGYPLRLVDVCILLVLFGQIRTPLTRFVPQAIEKLSQVRIATKRIDDCMRLATVNQRTSVMLSDGQEKQKEVIVMCDASFSWDSSVSCLSLFNVNIVSGTLVGITGPTGSGKSSLLAAILGEMTLLSGEFHINKNTFSYAPQSPWILADTIRANVLFGNSFDEQHYESVLRACCLDFDLTTFGPSGDLITVGEKGMNLSGGQKARISLARAVYADADIYLLDDPFAAVDPTVAQKIYDQCVGPNGLLRHKTRLLVTHQTRFLAESHQTILLAHGCIQAQGKFNELPIESQDKNTTDSSITTDKPMTTGMLDIGQSIVDVQSIIADEASLDSDVDWSLWCSLFTVPPLKWLGLVFMIFLLFFVEVLYDGTNCWVFLWSKQSYASQQHRPMLTYIFITLTLSTSIVALFRAEFFFYLILKGVNRLHDRMLTGVLYASMRFFESNSSGRILNRASRDQQIVDELLPVTLFDAIQSLLMICGALIIIGIVNPLLLAFIVPSLLVIWLLCRLYVRSNRQFKKLENLSRSPIYTLFSSSLNGLSTIRAFKVTETFIDLFNSRIDTNSRAYMTMLGSSYWLCFHLDLLAVLLPFIIVVVSVKSRNDSDLSTVAISLTYSVTMTGWFYWCIRQLFEAENLMTSAKRINEYVQLPQEEDDCDQKTFIPKTADWPNSGTIEFRNYSLRYRSHSEPTLKSINLHIASGEKIGIIGRTGAGKSSLFQGLFRLVDRSCIEGEIIIDGIDISRIPLSHLRSRLSVIPQQPILFVGTLRYNLDPFNQYSDEQCWEALEAVQLKEMARMHQAGLLLPVAESGNNLSVGQCQLICVARAILKQSKILLIDEATANVDERTDRLLQAVITEKFKDRTVLTIAHRLNTISTSDRLLVMEDGKASNFDTPDKILPSSQ